MRPYIPEHSLVPFVLAATGHRDLRPQDVDVLRDEIRGVLLRTRERMPSTPLVLMSGLAEGADQLVAEVGLEFGAALVAVLPMPVGVYKDQMSERVQENFDTLLAQAAFQVPLDGMTPGLEQLRTSEDARTDCYYRLAVFLAHHCQALIALWDGKHSDKRGGTASVVHYVIEGVPNERPAEQESHSGIVYHVITPRTSGDAVGQALTTHMLGALPGTAKDPTKGQAEEMSYEIRDINLLSVAHVMKNIEQFNRQAKSGEEHKGKHNSPLIPRDSVRRPLPDFLDRLESLYVQADATALRANSSRKHFFYAILATGGLGALAYSVHADMLTENVALWLSFPLLLEPVA
jgi:hypothetical protein